MLSSRDLKLAHQNSIHDEHNFTAASSNALQFNDMAQPPEGQRHDRTALILYGSETGNSQDVAEELGRVVEKLHFVTRVKEMDLVEIVCPSFVVLFIS